MPVSQEHRERVLRFQEQQMASAGTPKVRKNGLQTYDVIGASGEHAGWIQRIGPKNGGMWELQMKSSPREMIRFFKDAKVEAIQQAKRY